MDCMKQEKKKEEQLEQAYQLTINARNFHYDNFCKWMTFYYVAVGAIFVGFYTKTDATNTYGGLLAFLGFATSVFWHLSCKGYYFWIKNWIKLITRYEQNIKKNRRVYTVFSQSVKETQNQLFNPIESANISTSKITLAFSFLVSTVWCFLLLSKIEEKYAIRISDCLMLYKVMSALALTYLSTIIIGKWFSSNIDNHTPVKP